MSDSAPGGRRRFRYDATETVLVTDGYMSPKDAQDVLVDCLSEWGITGHSDADIDPFLSRIAHALRQGTSAERDFSKVYFEHKNNRCGFEVLKLAASKKDNSENPVRVWARSYGSGEMAVRTYDMLRDPENVQLREESALDYGCAMDVVHVSFDYADALPKFEDMKLSQIERYVIKQNTVNKVRTSRSAHIGGRDGGTVQDSASHAASVESAAPLQSGTSAGITSSGVKGRANFAAMR